MPYDDTDEMEESPEGDSYPSGTQQSGFATNDEGPFRCDNCTKYVGGYCTEPAVVNDPEAQQLRRLAPQGLKVLPGDCCNYIETPAMEAKEHGNEPRASRVERGMKAME